MADGYCNSRIMKYSKDGKFLAKYGDEGIFYCYCFYSIPHSRYHYFLTWFSTKDNLGHGLYENTRQAYFYN